MINNLELILPLMPTGENTFCHLQIVYRPKDHTPCETKNKGVINSFFIKSANHLKEIMPKVINLCEHYGARAYINVSHKDIGKLQKLLLTKLASLIYEGVIQDPNKTLNSVAGQLTSTHNVWVIDIDDLSLKDKVLEWLDDYFKLEPNIPFCCDRKELYLKGIIPTKQGCHILTDPFNLKEFQNKFPNIDVHKNSMGTLLYYPYNI